MSKKVEGKIALITGGSAGIGVATAKRFVKEDAFVYIAGRRKHQLADAVASIGSEITAIQGDVAKIADLGHIYAQIGQEKGGVDIVFANSDISPVARLGSITEEQFDPTFNMNVKGLLFTAQKALPLMPDDPHPATLEHGPAVDRSISVEARTDLEGFPLPSGHAGRGLRTTVALGAVIVAAGLGLWAYDDFTATPVRPAAVATPVQANVADRTDLTGQFSAVNQVVLRAQVSGYLTEIHFNDSQIVHKGDLLFVIDPRPYEIQLEQANAQFQTASAAAALANKQIDRSARLNRVGAEPDERLDETTQSQRAAAAAVKAAEAAIHAVQLT